MSERNQILGRIREALTISAPRPGLHSPPGQQAATHDHAPSDFKPWLSVSGTTFEEMNALFAENSETLKTDFQLLADRETLPAKLAELANREGWKKVATHSGQLTDFAISELQIPTLKTDNGYAPAELESCDVGITECDALIAQTGSVIVTARSAGGRALSILPPHHVVIAKREQMLTDLPAAFAMLKEKYGADFPSMMSLITGPSRTGDIERILVLGAHGPKKLTVFCI